METQEQKRSYVEKAIYLRPESFFDLTECGIQGDVLDDALNYCDAEEAVKYINMISLADTMYPATPLKCLSYHNFNETRCVIIGGMPQSNRIKDWTGSAYSYSCPSNITSGTILHDKIMWDVMNSRHASGKILADNEKMQKEGILMMHEALSVTLKDFHLCKTLWTPIISRILSHLTYCDNKVVVIFTNLGAMHTYKNAVLNSNLVLCLQGYGDTAFPDEPNAFQVAESFINRGKMAGDKIDFMELMLM
jgi:uracil DNA glycosylase